LSLCFRRVRLSLEDRLLIPSRMSICPSVRPSVCPRLSNLLQLDVFSWILILETSMKICRENPHLLKIGKNTSGTFQTWVHCVGKSRTKYSVARQTCKGNALFAFHCKTKVFYFILSQMWLNSKKGNVLLLFHAKTGYVKVLQCCYTYNACLLFFI